MDMEIIFVYGMCMIVRRYIEKKAIGLMMTRIALSWKTFKLLPFFPFAVFQSRTNDNSRMYTYVYTWIADFRAR